MSDNTYNPDLESRSEYYDRIDTIVDVLDNELRDHPDKGEKYDFIHQQVDSSRMVMYPHESLKMLQYSEYEPTGQGLQVEHCDTFSEMLAIFAYDVVRADVIDECKERDYL